MYLVLLSYPDQCQGFAEIGQLSLFDFVFPRVCHYSLRDFLVAPACPIKQVTLWVGLLIPLLLGCVIAKDYVCGQTGNWISDLGSKVSAVSTISSPARTWWETYTIQQLSECNQLDWNQPNIRQSDQLMEACCSVVSKCKTRGGKKRMRASFDLPESRDTCSSTDCFIKPVTLMANSISVRHRLAPWPGSW